MGYQVHDREKKDKKLYTGSTDRKNKRGKAGQEVHKIWLMTEKKGSIGQEELEM